MLGVIRILLLVELRCLRIRHTRKEPHRPSAIRVLVVELRHLFLSVSLMIGDGLLGLHVGVVGQAGADRRGRVRIVRHPIRQSFNVVRFGARQRRI